MTCPDPYTLENGIEANNFGVVIYTRKLNDYFESPLSMSSESSAIINTRNTKDKIYTTGIPCVAGISEKLRICCSCLHLLMIASIFEHGVSKSFYNPCFVLPGHPLKAIPRHVRSCFLHILPSVLFDVILDLTVILA